MDINAMNSVSKVAMPAQKTELNKPENNTVEPQKDGNKKLALALTALAATAAAGVGIAVAAKKGKIHLPTFKKSAQNIANDTIKALPNGADDAIKALPGAADDAAKAVKDVADDAAKAVKEGVEKKVLKQPGPFDNYNSEIKRLQNELKVCKDPKSRCFLERQIAWEQSGRWLQMENIKGDTLSESGKAFCRTRAAALEEQGCKISEHIIESKPSVILKRKKDSLFQHIKNVSTYRDANGNVTGEMKGLMKELTKYTGQTFDTPEQAGKFVSDELWKVFESSADYIEIKRLCLYDDISKIPTSEFRDATGKVTEKMKSLMKELEKYIDVKFATPEQMAEFVAFETR